MTRYATGEFKTSYSEIKTFTTCKRKWYLSYYRSLTKKKRDISKARDTGIAVHGILEEFYLGGGLDGEHAMEAATIWYENARSEDLELVQYDAKALKETADIYDLAWVVFEGYTQWLEQTGADTSWSNFRSEEKLEFEGPHGVIINGRLDLMADDADDDTLVVLDFKAVDSISRMVQSLSVDQSQGLFYSLLAKLTLAGDRDTKAVWSMLKRSKRTARAKPPFYQRHQLHMNPDMMRTFYERLHGVLGDMLLLERRLNAGESHQVVAYPNPNGDCSWSCEFYAICGMMNDPRSDVEWAIENHYQPRFSPNSETEVVIQPPSE